MLTVNVSLSKEFVACDFPVPIKVYIPVAIDVGFFIIQLGIVSPVNMENPKIKMFREEFMSVYY